MDLEALRQTVLNSSSSGTPATAYPELQKYYDINFQLPLSNSGVKALAGETKVRNDQADFDTAQQVQRLKDQAEGKGFTRKPREDGGFGFYDSVGNEISAYQYARATGKTAYEVLNDSDNPIDQQYARDYANLQDFMDAALSGDKETLNAFYKENPSLKGASPSDVLKKFKAAYPTVYGLKQAGQRLGQTFIPSLSQVKAQMDGGGFSDFEDA